MTTTSSVSIGRRVPWVPIAIAAVLTVVPLGVLAHSDGRSGDVVMVVAAASIAAYAAAVHPLSIFVGLGCVLGFAPYLDLPGSNIPVVLVLAVGVWVALLFLPGARIRPGWPEVWLLALAATALLSVVATGLSAGSLIELAAWVAGTALVVPIRFMPRDAQRTMARGFVLAASGAAAIGIVLVRIDPAGVLLERFAVVGYDQGQGNVRQVGGSEENTTRLIGTLVEPNVAGLILGAAALLAVVYFKGTIRAVLVVLLGTALMLTLSRAAIGTVVVAGALLVVRSHGSRRVVLLALGAAAGAMALVLPGVRDRLADSFGPSDAGTIARGRALEDFPLAMADHWVWGLGWDRAEFRDAGVGQVVNYVANGPLITIYRGGLVMGILAVVVLLVLVVRSWVVAKRSFDDAVLCCGVIAFVLVALQLDFPIVLQPAATALFSLLVGLSLRGRDA